MKRAVAYVGIPIQNTNEVPSLDAQEKSCIEYCWRQDLELVKTIRRERSSVQTDEQLQFRDLVRYCADTKNRIEALVVYAPSILPLEGTAKFINVTQYCRSRGFLLLFAENPPGFDSSTGGPSLRPVLKPAGSPHGREGGAEAELVFEKDDD